MSDEETNSIEELRIKIDELTMQLENLKKQNEEYLDGWKRAKADYVNFKNDQEKRSRELAQFASYALVAQLLPLAGHFKKAFACATDELKTMEWVKGIDQIYRQLKDILKGMGIQDMAHTVGSAFDPARHMAVGQEQRDDLDDNIVSQEIEEGYLFHDTVIAPAKVIVNKKDGPEIKEQTIAN